MIREAIDFQEFDVVDVRGEDEVVPFRPVRKSFIPGLAVRSGKAVLFDMDSSWIEALTEKIHQSGKNVDELQVLDVVAERMVTVMKLTVDMFVPCHAWLRDMLDPHTDYYDSIDPADRWADHRRYPRLAKLAKWDPELFKKFRTAMINNSFVVDLPDLISQNPEPRKKSLISPRYRY